MKLFTYTESSENVHAMLYPVIFDQLVFKIHKRFYTEIFCQETFGIFTYTDSSFKNLLNGKGYEEL